MNEIDTGDPRLRAGPSGTPALADAPRKGAARSAGARPAPRIPAHPQGDAFISTWPAPGGAPAAAPADEPVRRPRSEIGGEVLFIAAALGLLASLAWEGIASTGHWMATIFLGRRRREAVRRLMTRRPDPPARRRPPRTPAARLRGFLGAAGLLVWLAAGGSPGCKELDQTRWSIEAVLDQSDSQRSLQQDLRSFGDGFRARDFYFSVNHLFGLDDIQKSKESLEWDMRAFSDSGADRHGVLETIRMFGW